MHNSERYPYLTCIDSQALLAQCEKKEIKDGLSVLTQYLHNRKYLSPAGLNEALSFMAEEVLDKEGSGKLALKDDHLELFFKEFFEVPFPEPETPKFSFIDLFLVWETVSIRVVLLLVSVPVLWGIRMNTLLMRSLKFRLIASAGILLLCL